MEILDKEASVLQSTRELRCLSLKSCRIKSLEWLIPILGSLQLEVLALEDCSITDEMLRPLAVALASYPSLSHLGLAHNFITTRGFHDLICNLSKLGCIKLMDFEANRVRLTAAQPQLADELQGLLSLEHLVLADNPLGGEMSLAALMKCLPSALRSLNLSMVRTFLTALASMSN